MTAVGLPFEAGDHVVILRAQFDGGNILHAHHAAVRAFADHNVAELFRRLKPALGAYGIGEPLACDSWFASNLAGRIHRILRLHCIDDLADGDAQLRQPIGFHPDAHRVLPGVDLGQTYTVRARDRIVQIDVGVVGQEFRVVSALR